MANTPAQYPPDTSDSVACALYHGGIPVTDKTRKAYAEALAAGLAIAHFNSGSKTNPLNGWRVFRAQRWPGGSICGAVAPDYFGEGCIFSTSSVDVLLGWLAGYNAGRGEG